MGESDHYETVIRAPRATRMKIVTSTLVLLLTVAIGVVTNRITDTFTWAWAAGLAMLVAGAAAVQIAALLADRAETAVGTESREPDVRIYQAGRDVVLGVPGKPLIVAFASIVVVAIVILAVVLIVRPGEKSDANSPSKAQAEAELIAKLNPGGTFARLKELLGQEPDRMENLASGLVAQFDRDLDYIHVVVDGSDKVNGITIIAKDGVRLQPTGVGAWPSAFGRTMSDYQAEVQQDPDGAAGICAVRHAAYLHVIDQTDAVHQFQHMAFGFIDTSDFICSAYDLSLTQCEPDGTPGSFAACLNQMNSQSPDALRIRSSIVTSAMVVTAPGVDVSTDMLRLTYDFSAF